MSKQPHIIIFNPDQWRGDVLGHLGNPAAVTPNLDRLVEEDGVSYKWSFCQNPVCTPSRCSFMTGWYPHVRGHRTMFHMLHEEWGEKMLLPILRENGYHVFWGGKNDLVPGQMNKDQYAETWSDYSRYEKQPNWHGPVYQEARGKQGDDSFYSFFIGEMKKKEGEKYYHDDDWLHVMEAIRLIKNRPDDRPLCLYLPLVYPHPPYGVEEPFFSAIDRSALPGRIPVPENLESKPRLIKGLIENFGMENWTEERWTELRAVYYGMCARIDSLFGEVISALQEEGLYDDSAIFFFSDHGDFTGDYGLVEKTQNTYEDCLSRVPFIVKPPKDTPCKPGVRDTMAELVDFTETVYDLTGIDPGYDRFGKSLLPSLADEGIEHRETAFCEGGRLKGESQSAELESNGIGNPEHPYYPRLALQAKDDPIYHGKAAMCRTKEFKYVRRMYEDDELYDLKNDPGEVNNLINDPAYADALNMMKDRMLEWYIETADVVPRETDSR